VIYLFVWSFGLLVVMVTISFDVMHFGCSLLFSATFMQVIVAVFARCFSSCHRFAYNRQHVSAVRIFKILDQIK